MEGKGDKKFILDYLDHLKLAQIDEKGIIVLGGWTNLPNVKNKFIEFSHLGYNSLVIFDADSNPFKRRTEITKMGKKLQVEFKLFLFPNNKEKGTLESLLLKIASLIYQNIFSCFDNYKDCLDLCKSNYFLPDNKAKVYAYLEALRKETNIDKRDFLDAQLWDMDNTYCDPLKVFLSKHF
ncbi:MAG: DUF3226 domain-containing protein [Chitinophagaceae bacterium]